MKTVIYIIIWIALILYVAGITITMKPFAIKFKSLDIAIAVFCFVVAFIIIEHHYYEKGKQDVVNEIVKEFDKTKEIK